MTCRDGELRDVAALLRAPAEPTCGYGPDADMPPRAIDQIRVNRPAWRAAVHHEVVGGEQVETASDHRMVTARIDTNLIEE